MKLAVYHPRAVLRDTGYTLEELFRAFVEARSRRIGFDEKVSLPGKRLQTSAAEVRESRLRELRPAPPLEGERELGELTREVRRQLSWEPSESTAQRPAGEVLESMLPLRPESSELLVEVIELIQLPFTGRSIYRLEYGELLSVVNRLLYRRALAESITAEELFDRVGRPEHETLTAEVPGLAPVVSPGRLIVARAQPDRPLVSTGTFWARFLPPSEGTQTAVLSAVLSPDERELVEEPDGRERLREILRGNYR